MHQITFPSVAKVNDVDTVHTAYTDSRMHGCMARDQAMPYNEAPMTSSGQKTLNRIIRYTFKNGAVQTECQCICALSLA